MAVPRMRNHEDVESGASHQVEEHKTGNNPMTSESELYPMEGQKIAHDQLPSLEDAKIAAFGPQTSRCNKRIGAGILLAGAALLLLLSINHFSNNAPAAPTLAPAAGSRKFDVLEYLFNQNISSSDALSTPGTPQYQAAKWIANEDEFRMAVPPVDDNNSNSVHNRFVERYALAVLYFATGGPKWKHGLNFLSPTDICEWKDDVALSSSMTVAMGVQRCVPGGATSNPNEQYAHTVTLYSNLMEGTIPDEIRYLRQLKSLSISDNLGISGKLTSGFSSLVNLEELELEQCSFAGTLPDWIGDLSALTKLSLSNNLLGGDVLPNSLFTLESLHHLGLDGNFFGDDISRFGKLTNLVSLRAKDTALRGKITSELVRSWPDMYELDLSQNSIDGSLPRELFEMQKLLFLDLHSNKISGTLPMLFAFSLTNRISGNTPHISPGTGPLTFLSLSDNHLTGLIPTTLAHVTNLVHLDLGKNKLRSSLPSEIGDLTQLRNLYTNSNDFDSHHFPTLLEKLIKLEQLSMNGNNLIGTIPKSIQALTSLRLLDLGHNQLSSTIPQEIGLLRELDFLSLQKNQLSGGLPFAMAMMDDLDVLLIDGNRIIGSADMICNHYETIGLQFFASDCLGEDPEIICSCCNVCCNDESTDCGTYEWRSDSHPYIGGV